MKKNYNLKKLIKDKASFICASALLVAGFNLNAQTTYTFTNAGATGSVGPTQAQINTAYLTTNLNGMVTATAGTQYWVVPTSGNYGIEAQGASGGGVNGGYGSRMIGNFVLNAGDSIIILPGQMGLDGLDGSTTGGGGSFVLLRNAASTITTSAGRPVSALVIAGGGGGNPGVAHIDCNGIITATANNGNGVNGSGIGGMNGNGGGIAVPSGNNRGGGGGGFLTDGEHTGTCGTGGLESGRSFLNGGTGGLSTNCSVGYQGGFGGGGGAISSGWRSSGGGGGYSGGGGGQTNSIATTHRGGGGGSFNGGTSQLNSVATTTGNGKVIITSLCTVGAIPTNTTQVANQTICANNATTLSVVGTGTLNWYATSTSTTVLATGAAYSTPTLAAGNYTYYAASTNTCGEGARAPITITVNANPSVSAVSNTSLICVGQSASLTASGANTYTWNTAATTTVIVVSPTITTSYTVTGTGTTSCNNAVVITQSVSTCTGIEGTEFLTSIINIYPNPSNGEFTIATDSDMNLSIVNNLGQVVKEISINSSNNYKASVSNLANGIYFIVGENNDQIIKQKIIVSK